MFGLKFDVLTIGTGTRDVFVRTSALKPVKNSEHLEHIGFPAGAQCLPAGGKIEVDAPLVTIGGGAANAAVTFARQGLRTGALLKIGRDDAGYDIGRDLARERVKTIPVYDPKEATAYSVVLLSENGERTILHYRGASKDLRADDIPFRRLRTRWAYIVPGHISPSVIQKLIYALKKEGTKIAMNPSEFYVKFGWKKLAIMLRKIDVIFMNREEASVFTGIGYEDERGIFRKLDELIGGIAVMTDGKRGVMASDGKKIYRAGTFKEKKVLDRTGAGDAFGSGFVSALARKTEWTEKDIAEAIRVATANATSVVEHLGAEKGILRHRDLADSRWKKLPVHIKNI